MCSVVCIWWLEFCFFFFKQKTAYEMRISDWSSDVCSSDLALGISQCGQYGLLIARRRLPLNGLTGAYLRAHAAAVEQSPRNEWQDRERSEERRVGKACVSTCRSRCSSYH